MILDAGTPGARALLMETTDGGTGQYVIGTFTADAATQTFSVQSYTNMLTTPASAINNSFLNALQVRDITGVVIAVNPDASTVSASPAAVPADGTTASTITVTLIDTLGLPVPDKDVTLAGSPGGAVISPATAVTTNSSGQAAFNVKSTSAGTVVFTATNTTDSQTITQTASVAFVSSADAELSTVAAVPSYVNADGTTTSTITVSLKATGNVPVAGKSVTLAQTLGTGATITPATAQISDSNGQVLFTVLSSTPGAAEFTATDTTDSVFITQKGSVQFVGPGNAGTSTLAASPVNVAADGSSTSTITVTLKDAAGFPAAGREVSLAAGTVNPTITPASAFTNTSGVATFTVSSSTVGTEVFTATDVTDSVVITQAASVNFVDPSVPRAFHVNFVQFTPVVGNFEDPATLSGPAGGSGETWNQFRAVSGSNLLASDGTATGVAVTTNFTECRSRSTGSLTLLKHALTDFDKGLSRTVTISGLPPGSLYNIWLASTANMGVASENANGTFSTTNSTSTVGGQMIDQSVTANTTTWQQGNNYALLENVVVNGSGQIVITAASTAGYRLPLSGFQLVPASKARIISFSAAGNPGLIDQGAFTIAVTVPFGTNLATLAPTFTLNSGTCNQTSGSPPSPTFAAANPVTYTVTDGDTSNSYAVTVTVAPALGTLVINLGTSPAGTFIAGSQFIGSGPTNLPLPALPVGSILRSIAVNTKLESTDNDNFGSDLCVLLDPTPGVPGGDFSVKITNGEDSFAATLALEWPDSQDAEIVDTKTDATWAAVAPIDLATTGLFLGNGYGGPTTGGTWSGTITLTYDLVSTGSPYETWAGGALFANDKNSDGVKNGLAFLLGAESPDANALGRLPDPSKDGSGLVLEFDMLNSAKRGNAKLSVQWSSDLGVTDPWSGNSALVPDEDATVNGVVFDITPGDPLNGVKVTIPSSEGPGGRLFGRLSGTEN
jgi:hypothetical protein